jgi:hypothetical protein
MLIVKNRDCCKSNSDVHTCNTRFNHDLHLLVANLTIFQEGGCYSGIKLYNHLPPVLKQLSHDIPKFRFALKNLIEEYNSWN